MEKVKTSSKPVVLVAPLDWGLGHATRCIPIIRELIRLDFKVILAAEGLIKELFIAEFPEIKCLHLQGYRIKYARYKSLMPFKIALQIPSILSSIRKENKWLKHSIDSNNIDIVISDNRYGLHSKKATCIFITHQLEIRSGLGRIVNRSIQKLNYNYIRKFNQCWIPDFKELPGLAGSLSHPSTKPETTIQYLGPLSRFQRTEIHTEEHLLFLLSGPEPQRSIFEKILVKESKTIHQKIILVRGTNNSSKPADLPDNVTVYDLLPSTELSILIDKSSFVIARSGYSTVMDMIIKKKKCIFVPTPGQTEQLYLANHLMKHQLAFCQLQTDFNLSRALHMATVFRYQYTNEIEPIKISELLLQL